MSDIEIKLPPLEEYFVNVGLLASYWNKVEGRLDDLLTCFIGDAQKAHILTSGANIARRISLLKGIVEQCHTKDPWQQTVLAALAAFDVLRQNRNTVIHGVATNLKEADGVVVVRSTNNDQSLHQELQECVAVIPRRGRRARPNDQDG